MSFHNSLNNFDGGPLYEYAWIFGSESIEISFEIFLACGPMFTVADLGTFHILKKSHHYLVIPTYNLEMAREEVEITI